MRIFQGFENLICLEVVLVRSRMVIRPMIDVSNVVVEAPKPHLIVAVLEKAFRHASHIERLGVTIRIQQHSN